MCGGILYTILRVKVMRANSCASPAFKWSGWSTVKWVHGHKTGLQAPPCLGSNELASTTGCLWMFMGKQVFCV